MILINRSIIYNDKILVFFSSPRTVEIYEYDPSKEK